MFADAPPLVGYAVTGRLSSGDPPVAGAFFRDRGDLWTRILETPAPRILVLEDMDEKSGRGAFVGDVHAAILNALGCAEQEVIEFCRSKSVCVARPSDLTKKNTLDGEICEIP